MQSITDLQPQEVWKYFNEICQIPRPSKHEAKIIEYLKEFASIHNLECETDEVGNVLICKDATKGFENKKGVILQSHIDMVCEKNSDSSHDFMNDAIETIVEDKWLRANNTTLGADDGIGVAAQLAILASNDIDHGRIECLFTVDEETGMTGALGLEANFLKSSILLNLDSEDDGEIFIGCAGGIDTTAFFDIETETLNGKYFSAEINISGLKGGHSGDDIDKGLANANKILVRFLHYAQDELGLRISKINGGNLRNAIAREASALVAVPFNKKEELRAEFNIFTNNIAKEYEITEPKISFSLQSCSDIELVLSSDMQCNLLNALMACPHGVISYSQEIKGLVETSTNLASIKQSAKSIEVSTSQRSSVESSKDYVANMVASVFKLAQAKVKQGDGYPGWQPNPKSEILKIAVDSYKKLFDTEPTVRAIHAGLECGLFLQKYPNLDMVSIGPTIRGAHSPSERIEIETVNKFWLHLKDMLLNIADR